MWLLLKILGGLGVLVLLALVVFFWKIRRAIQNGVREYNEIARLELPAIESARLAIGQLSDIEVIDDARWIAWSNLGFGKLGDFEVGRFASRADQLHLFLPSDDSQACTLFALTNDKKLLAISSHDGVEIQRPNVHWVLKKQDPAEMIAGLLTMCQAHACLALDLRAARMVFERAYAGRRDIELMQRPDLQLVRERAAKLSPPLRPDQIETAIENRQHEWECALKEALIDNYKRDAKPDAATWDQFGDEIVLVHSLMDAKAVRELLGDLGADAEAIERFCIQGASAQNCFESFNRSRAKHLQYVRLGEVSRPVAATLYVMRWHLAPESAGEWAAAEGEHTSEQVSEHTLSQRTYRATNAAGDSLTGSIEANSNAAALETLKVRGLQNIEFIHEPNYVNTDFRPDQVAAAIEVCFEPHWKSVGKAILRNWILWFPTGIWAGLAFVGTRPFTASDNFAFAAFAFALVVLATLIAPMMLYNALLRARVFGEHAKAWRCATVLSRLPMFGLLKPSFILCEFPKILASEGKLEEALAMWREFEQKVGPEEYLSVLASIYCYAGDARAMTETQRKAVRVASSPDNAKLDLAMSLLRFGGRQKVEEAEALFKTLGYETQSELAKAVVHYCRALAFAGRAQHQFAVQQFQTAASMFAKFTLPLTQQFLAEGALFQAISSLHLGRCSEAEELWKSAQPVLRHSRLHQPLIEQFLQLRGASAN